MTAAGSILPPKQLFFCSQQGFYATNSCGKFSMWPDKDWHVFKLFSKKNSIQLPT